MAAVRLAHTTVGTGPRPLLIAHGLLGQARNWRSLQRALSGRLPECNVTAVDLRNHGASPHSPDMTLEDMAADLVVLLDEQQRDKADKTGERERERGEDVRERVIDAH
jgi:esterase